jgi:hypothetical protein
MADIRTWPLGNRSTQTSNMWFCFAYDGDEYWLSCAVKATESRTVELNFNVRSGANEQLWEAIHLCPITSLLTNVFHFHPKWVVRLSATLLGFTSYPSHIGMVELRDCEIQSQKNYQQISFLVSFDFQAGVYVNTRSSIIREPLCIITSLYSLEGCYDSMRMWPLLIQPDLNYLLLADRWA